MLVLVNYGIILGIADSMNYSKAWQVGRRRCPKTMNRSQLSSGISVAHTKT